MQLQYPLDVKHEIPLQTVPKPDAIGNKCIYDYKRFYHDVIKYKMFSTRSRGVFIAKGRIGLTQIRQQQLCVSDNRNDYCSVPCVGYTVYTIRAFLSAKHLHESHKSHEAELVLMFLRKSVSSPRRFRVVLHSLPVLQGCCSVCCTSKTVCEQQKHTL